MKKPFLLLVLALLCGSGYASGARQEVALENCCSKRNSIFLVTIKSYATGIVTELDRKDSSVSRMAGYKAVIEEIINRSADSTPSPEKWHIIFTGADKKAVDKIKARSLPSLKTGDEIIILDYENILYSIFYHVENRHRIFIYYHCPDAARPVKIGATYYFVANNNFSKENGVLYGNIDEGLFPATIEIRKKIEAGLKNDSRY